MEALDSNLVMWNLVAGFLIPPVLAILMQPVFSKTVRALLAFVVALGIAIVTTALEGELNFEDWVTSALVVMVTAISTYKGFWKPTGVAPEIERSTSPSANR